MRASANRGGFFRLKTRLALGGLASGWAIVTRTVASNSINSVELLCGDQTRVPKGLKRLSFGG